VRIQDEGDFLHPAESTVGGMRKWTGIGGSAIIRYFALKSLVFL
jgi:hypothetical protein